MRAVDRSGLVDIIRGGVAQTVPYRQAVGLVSTGRASWADSAPVDAPVAPVKVKRAKGGPKPAVSVDVPSTASSGGVSVSWSDVSTPTQTGVEGDLAGNEPPPFDP